MSTKGERYYTFYNDENDKAILQGIIIGDEKALKAAIDRYQQQMMIEAFSLLKDVQEAEDMIQEIFIRIWENRERLGNQKYASSIGPYLLRATRNKCLDKIAHNKIINKRNAFFSQNLSPSHHSNPSEIKELRSSLQSAIDSLPPKTRSSFKKLYEEDLTQKEIALQEGVSLQTVKNTISNGLRMLREKLRHFQ